MKSHIFQRSGSKAIQTTWKRNYFSSFAKIFHVTVCLFCVGMMSVPFIHLNLGFEEQLSMAPSAMFVAPWQTMRPYGFSNSYGLFRRMTGVGNNNNYASEQGWAGVPPSIVERPEIILEGLFMKDNVWKELKFRWKPGNVYDMPKQVVPHQPRVSIELN